MRLFSRHMRVYRLMDNVEFTQRLISLITAYIPFGQEPSKLDLFTRGCIPPAALEGAYVVWIASGKSVVARIRVLASVPGATRLLLGQWKDFENIDSTMPPLTPGVYIWLDGSFYPIASSRRVI